MEKSKKKYRTVNQLSRDRKTWLYIFLGVIIIFSVPLLIKNIYIGTFADYTNSGQIGDTIGGITAPFINIISAILVYFAFRAQIDANRQVQDQINNDGNAKALMTVFEYLDKHLTNIDFVEIDKANHTGAKAISFILIAQVRRKKVPNSDLAEYLQVLSILRLYKIVITKIKESKASMSERELVFELLYQSYYTYYFPAEKSAIDFVKNLKIDYRSEISTIHKNLVTEIELNLKWFNHFFGLYNEEVTKGSGKEISDFKEFLKKKDELHKELTNY